LLLSANGEIESLEEGGLVLAFTPDAPYLAASVTVNPGDRLLLYTDGLLEAANLQGAFFGDKRLFESLRAAMVDYTEGELKNIGGIQNDEE